MTASMTAFARQEASADWGRAVWELRTVNHRYLDMSIRLPEELRFLEGAVREKISSSLARGKVDCSLRYESGGRHGGELLLNMPLVEKLVQAAASLPVENASAVDPLDILSWPGVIEQEKLDQEILSRELLAVLGKTLDLLVESRQREGEKLQALVLERCVQMKTQVEGIRGRLPEIGEKIRERFLRKARELEVELDAERLEQEMLILAQKMDVAEELDRLDAHIIEVTHILAQDEPVGRRLDFLMQEMNREANTLGSKAANVDMSNVSIELKVLIEQMREQIQNIE